jgi:methylmalonyl-CoA/ethylmalonyl-CoA epimerase
VTKNTVLDHVAIGARALTDSFDLFGGVLGGTWAYGGQSPGFWWGQLRYSTGPKIEVLTPTGGPDAAFLERFLAARAAAPHHFNFIVADIAVTLPKVQALGIEPVRVNLRNARWKEAFLHPKDAYGIVIQVAEQAGSPPSPPRPAELPAAGPASAFALIEHEVDDLDDALRLFGGALDGHLVGRLESAGAPAAELSWDNGARLRLVQAAPPVSADGRRRVGRLRRLSFTRDGAAVSEAERRRAAELAARVSVDLELRRASSAGRAGAAG